MGRRWPSGSPALPFLGLARPVRVGRTVSPPTAPACLPCPSRQTGASFSRPALLWPWAALQPSSLNGGVTGCFPQRALHPDPAVTHNSQPAWQVPETGGTQPRPELVSTGTDSPCGQTRRKRLSNTEGKLRHSPSIQTKHEGHSHFVTHSPPPPRGRVCCTAPGPRTRHTEGIVGSHPGQSCPRERRTQALCRLRKPIPRVPYFLAGPPKAAGQMLCGRAEAEPHPVSTPPHCLSHHPRLSVGLPLLSDPRRGCLWGGAGESLTRCGDAATSGVGTAIAPEAHPSPPARGWPNRVCDPRLSPHGHHCGSAAGAE